MRTSVWVAVIAVLSACRAPGAPVAEPSAPTVEPAAAATEIRQPAQDIRDAAAATIAAGPAEVRLELAIGGPDGALRTTTRGRFAPAGDATYAVALDLPGADQEVRVEREGGTTWFRWLGAEQRLPGGARWVSAPRTIDPLLLAPRSAEVATAAAYAVLDPFEVLGLVADRGVVAADDEPARSELCCDFHDGIGPTLALAASERAVILRDGDLRRPILPLVPPPVETALRNAPDRDRVVAVSVDPQGRVRRVEVTLERQEVDVHIRLDVLRWVDAIRVSPPPADVTITADDAVSGRGDA